MKQSGEGFQLVNVLTERGVYTGLFINLGFGYMNTFGFECSLNYTLMTCKLFWMYIGPQTFQNIFC